MKKKKAPRRYKPGELVHDAFRMKTREESQPGVCVGVYKENDENWMLCASPRAKHGQTDRAALRSVSTRRDGEVRAASAAAGGRRALFRMSENDPFGSVPKRLLQQSAQGEACNDDAHRRRDVTLSYWSTMARTSDTGEGSVRACVNSGVFL